MQRFDETEASARVRPEFGTRLQTKLQLPPSASHEETCSRPGTHMISFQTNTGGDLPYSIYEVHIVCKTRTYNAIDKCTLLNQLSDASIEKNVTIVAL